MSLMSSYKLPCGTKSYYPEKLDYLFRTGKRCMFHTQSSKEIAAFIVAPAKKGVDVIVKGSMMDIVKAYEEIDLPEQIIKDDNGVFFYKFCESNDKFEEIVANLNQDHYL